jgi:hypothetical protein
LQVSRQVDVEPDPLSTTIVRSVSPRPPDGVAKVGLVCSPDVEEDGVTGMVAPPGFGPERPAVW